MVDSLRTGPSISTAMSGARRDVERAEEAVRKYRGAPPFSRIGYAEEAVAATVDALSSIRAVVQLLVIEVEGLQRIVSEEGEASSS